MHWGALRPRRRIVPSLQRRRGFGVVRQRVSQGGIPTIRPGTPIERSVAESCSTFRPMSGRLVADLPVTRLRSHCAGDMRSARTCTTDVQSGSDSYGSPQSYTRTQSTSIRCGQIFGSTPCWPPQLPPTAMLRIRWNGLSNGQCRKSASGSVSLSFSNVK